MTRAITIAAPAADVWPWLIQMGQGRGGLYTYEWIENLLGAKIHNLDPGHRRVVDAGDQWLVATPEVHGGDEPMKPAWTV